MLYEFRGSASQHLHDTTTMPSAFDSCEIIQNDSSRKAIRKNRSSSSGFSKAEPASGTVRHTLTTDGVKRELSDQDASYERQSSPAIVKQFVDQVPSESTSWLKSGENSGTPVKSWAAVLAESKNTRPSASAAAARVSRSDQSKLAQTSVKNTPVNCPSELKSLARFQSDKSKPRSATRRDDRMQLSSSDGAGNRTKSNDRMSVQHDESQSAAWITVSSRDRKTKSTSQTCQSHSDVSEQLTGSYTAINCTQAKQLAESTGISDGATVPSGLQLKAAKQKKKKKKKSKGPAAAVEETSNLLERTGLILSPPAPEFDDLSEFPSLFSAKSGSKKTPFQTSSAYSTVNTLGITYLLFLVLVQYMMYCVDIS